MLGGSLGHNPEVEFDSTQNKIWQWTSGGPIMAYDPSNVTMVYTGNCVNLLVITDDFISVNSTHFFV